MRSFILFAEDEQLRGRKTPDVMTQEMEKLAVSNQHIQVRGRGDNFGRLRSLVIHFINSFRCLHFQSQENDERVPLKQAVFSPTNDTKIIVRFQSRNAFEQ